MKILVESFSKGKNEPKNEDRLGYSENRFILSDGATDKTGLLFDGKSGGELISQLVVEESLKVDLTGIPLVNFLTEKVIALYEKIIPKAINASEKRSNATLVCVHVSDGEVIITQVGDSSFRINGSDLYENTKIIDTVNANKRSEYIHKTGDVKGGRQHIMESLEKQHIYQNNRDSEYGHGCIDGASVPDKFIRVFKFPVQNIKTIELISDGYFSIPNTVSLEAYEEEYQKVEREDPDKYIKYLSTKSSDDRSVMIIRFLNS